MGWGGGVGGWGGGVEGGGEGMRKERLQTLGNKRSKSLDNASIWDLNCDMRRCRDRCYDCSCHGGTD